MQQVFQKEMERWKVQQESLIQQRLTTIEVSQISKPVKAIALDVDT